MHLVITDSGLGGLGICAAIERNLRHAGGGPARLTYVNAWPEEGRGYNSILDEAARVAVFDRALAYIEDLQPDRIVIACNTLSVLYGATAFAEATTIPVVGIIEAGVSLFAEAMRANPGSRAVLFGTAITIQSGIHRRRLIDSGIESGRIEGVSCHGLATAIESDADGDAVGAMIDECVSRVTTEGGTVAPVFAGLCCTHYGYVADRFHRAMASHLKSPVGILDPNHRLVSLVAPGNAPGTTAGGAVVTVDVVSKVRLGDETRRGIGRLVAATSSPTAYALQTYTHVADLF